MVSRNIFLLAFLLVICVLQAQSSYDQKPLNGEKVYLNYEDLVALSQIAKPQGELLEKLNKQLYTPIVRQPSKHTSYFLRDVKLGEFFRVALWNIERGFNIGYIKKIFTSVSSQMDKYKEETQSLQLSKIIILNEVDYGMPRTGYRNIAKGLASVLGYGYVFGTEFVEVDPYQLGIKKFTEEEKVFLEPEAIKEIENLQKEKYLGLHGTAILSAYPILSAQIVRLPECYKWYEEEAAKLSVLEKVRREGAEVIFSEKVLTELRHGGRMAIIADLLLPNKQKITVVATHLENRCLPECRANQFKYLLDRLVAIKNPVILAGDFNTTGTDSSPVSIKKEILKRVKDPEFVAKQAISALTSIGFFENIVVYTVNKLRQFKNPTHKDIPLILPNKEAKIFNLLREFKFNDGYVFDLRGVKERSYKSKAGFLSNSNERGLKGYKETFELPVTLGFAKFKLDWFFIKPLYLKSPRDKYASYAYAPHFGRTLHLVNVIPNTKEKISDHYPIIVDIPVGEPRI